MNSKQYDKLIGSKVAFFISDATGRRSGYFGRRIGTVVGVDAGVRKGFRSVRVRLGSSKFIKSGWAKPVHIKVLRKELSLRNHNTGVMDGDAVIPLGAWLVKNGIESVSGA